MKTIAWGSASRALFFCALLVSTPGFCDDPGVEDLAGWPTKERSEGTQHYFYWAIGDSDALWQLCREEGFPYGTWESRYELSKDGGSSWASVTPEGTAHCAFDWLVRRARDPLATAGTVAGVSHLSSKWRTRKPYDLDVGLDHVADESVVELEGQWLMTPQLGIDAGIYGGGDAYGGALTIDSRDTLGISGLDLTLTGGLGQADRQVDFGDYGEDDTTMTQSAGGILMSYALVPTLPASTAMQGIGFRLVGNQSDGDSEQLERLVDGPQGLELRRGSFDVSGGRHWKAELAALSSNGASLSMNKEAFDDRLDGTSDLDPGWAASAGFHRKLAGNMVRLDLDAGYAFDAEEITYDAMASVALLGGRLGARLADSPFGRQQELFYEHSCFSLELFNVDQGLGDDDSGLFVHYSINCANGPKGLGIGRSLASDLSQRLEDRDHRIARPVRGAGVRGLITAASRTVRAEMTDESITVIEPLPVNQVPVAVITGMPTGIQPGQSITLDGSNSSDPEGPIAAYLWSASGACSLSGPVDGVTATAVVDANAAAGSQCTVTLQVTDGDGASATASVQGTVGGPANQPPVAVITGMPALVFPGQPIPLDGSTSSDADGTIAAYSWSASGVCSILGATGGVTATAVVDDTATIGDLCAVSLQVTDDDGASDTTDASSFVEGAGVP